LFPEIILFDLRKRQYLVLDPREENPNEMGIMDLSDPTDETAVTAEAKMMDR
jgi:hypothetical protein